MADFSSFRVIFKLSVLLGVIVIQHDSMFEFVFADLHIQPLWKVDGNNSQSCSIETLQPQEEKYIFHGRAYTSCSIQIEATSVYLYPVIDVPSEDTHDDSLFLVLRKRVGEKSWCGSRFVKVVGQAEFCSFLILQAEVLLHLQGNASLVISEVPDMPGLTRTQLTSCPESYDDDVAGLCHNVTVYDQQIRCESQYNEYNPNVCQIEVRSPHCNYSFSLREVESHCLIEEQIEEDLSMVVIPSSTLYLYLQYNNIVQLVGSPFYGLNYLQLLDLKSNYLTLLHAGTFSGLDMLLELDLSSNELSWLDGEVFQGLHDLYMLVLYGNQLVTLHPDLFHDLRSLRQLELDDNNLASLPEGLFRNLTNVQKLYLFANSLAELHPSILHSTSKLLLLHLSINELTTLPSELFSATKHLELLSLAQNNLITLDESLFFGLWNLVGLYVEDNMFSVLPVLIFQNVSLVELDLSINKLVVLNGSYFDGMIHLRDLYLQENNLNYLSGNLFHGLGSLQYLLLHRNNLSHLTTGLFHGLKNLQVLGLHANQLESLDADVFEGLEQLVELYLLENKLRSLPAEIFQDLVNLVQLDMSFNQLVMLEDNIFRNVLSLVRLTVHNNNLTMLPENLLSNLTNLQQLHLSHNQIEALDVILFGESQEQLVWLALSNNQIAAVHDDIFKGLVSVHQLDFNHNLLTTLPEMLFQDMQNLELLYLNNNELVALDTRVFQGLSWLRLLALNDNDLRVLQAGLFASLINLRQLYLYGNHLVSLQSHVFYGLNNLKELLMQNNSLYELPETVFQNLTNLKVLDMTDNEIGYLGAGIFGGLVDLRYLLLAHNDIKVVDDNLLEDTVKLKYLELSHNRLDDVPRLVINLTGLEYVSLRNNPLFKVQQSSLDSVSNLELLVSQHEICECYVTTSIQCSAANKRSPYLTCERMLADRVLMGMMWVIGVGAIIGNAFVIGFRQKNKVKNKVQGFLLSNLALSDFLMGVYMLIVASADIIYGKYFPMHSENWRSGITCRFAGALSIISSEASVFFVMLISIDRFVCIRFPYSTRKIGFNLAIALCLITWTIALALGIAPSVLSGINFKFYDNSHVCIGLPLALTKTYFLNESKTYIWAEESIYTFIPVETFETTFEGEVNGLFFSTAVFFGLNFICYLVIVACYIEIVRAVKASSEESGRTRDMKEQITMTVKVSAIVATDFLCWFPIIVLGVLVQTRTVTLPASVFAWLVTIALPINSAINPYLYTLTDVIANYKKKQAEKRLNLIKKHSKRNTKSGSVKTIDTISQNVNS
ncbi:uncharacterized protein [Amphiura filiformis]|uniref:uncharacterized protein n=1 Tax=Amphiura filiformis TaxID=82378 RepID=UPI003B2275FF